MDPGHCLLERMCPCSLLARNIIYLVVGLNSNSSVRDGASRRYDKRNLTVWSALAFDILAITRIGFGGLGVACWPLVPTFVGSNPAEAVGFLGRKNPQHAFLRRGSKAVGPMS